MACLLATMSLLVASPSVSADFSDLILNVTEASINEIITATDVIDKSSAAVLFSQCQNIKKIIGVAYEDIEEPDLSQLTLNFITNETEVKFNLTRLSEVATYKHFKPQNGLIIYMHGFASDTSSDSVTTIQKAFLAQGIYNILALDASSIIKYRYFYASTMVTFIGEALAAALAAMIEAGLDASSVHLIGHSLGSHIASFAGKTLYNQTGKKVGRISGLDPAGPCFSDVDSSLRLNKTDADFVDVIHTDAGVLGLYALLGHVDYAPNSGSEQPGCVLQTCSHNRAWEYFAESVSNTTGFLAVECDSWKAYKNGDCENNTVSYMGYGSKPNTTGLFYLQTAAESPYALGTDGIKHDVNDGVVRTIRDVIGL